jgi:hypothetical protein
VTPRGVPARALLAAALAAASAPAAAVPPEPRPLPVDRTQKLQDEGAVYTVEGRVRIPRGVELSVFMGTTIRGTGSAPAVVEVEGGFDLVGVQGKEVVLEDVTVEPRGEFEGIRLETVIVRGKGGVRCAREAPASGEILLELADFVKPAAIDLAFRSGSVVLSSLCVETPVRILGVEPEPGKRSRLEATVRNCQQSGRYRCAVHGTLQGLLDGLAIDGADQSSVVGSRISGEMLSLRNWSTKLLVDGSKLATRKLEIVNSEAGQMSKVQFVKCDVYSTEVWVCAPPRTGLRDAIVMDRCWFRGLEDPAEILAKRIRDGEKLAAANGARVLLGKVSPKANGLGGPAEE